MIVLKLKKQNTDPDNVIEHFSWTADNSAGSSLYKDCLLVNLSFTEQLSVSIFGIRGVFKTLDSAFFKT